MSFNNGMNGPEYIQQQTVNLCVKLNALLTEAKVLYDKLVFFQGKTGLMAEPVNMPESDADKVMWALGSLMAVKTTWDGNDGANGRIVAGVITQ